MHLVQSKYSLVLNTPPAPDTFVGLTTHVLVIVVIPS
jgi:hypothetical protein